MIYFVEHKSGHLRLALLALMAALLLLPGRALAFAHGEERSITDAGEAAAFLARLDESLYVADGRTAERPVTVFFNTDDPLALRLFEQGRALAQTTQIRWVPVGGPYAGRLAAQRSGRDLVSSFQQIRAGATAPEANSGAEALALLNNRMILRQFAERQGFREGAVFPLPLIVFEEGNRLTLHALSAEPVAAGTYTALAARVANNPSRAMPEPAAMRYLGGVTMETVAPRPFTPPEGGLDLHLFSDPASVIVAHIDGNENITINGTSSQGWYRVANAIEGHPAYFYAPDAMLPDLPQSWESMVRPFEHIAYYALRPVEVRTAPSRSARVLTMLDRDAGYAATGAIVVGGRRWLRLEVWENGGAGYVPAGDMAP